MSHGRDLHAIARMADSCELRKESRRIVNEKTEEAKGLVSCLPYAYNHPPMMDEVLIYYLVHEFLETMELFNTLAVFSTEASFDSSNYTEYHPVLGLEWFIKSFFVSEQYQGLLPILLRFYKPAGKRVHAYRKRLGAITEKIDQTEVENLIKDVAKDANINPEFRGCPLVREDIPPNPIEQRQRRYSAVSSNISNRRRRSSGMTEIESMVQSFRAIKSHAHRSDSLPVSSRGTHSNNGHYEPFDFANRPPRRDSTVSEDIPAAEHMNRLIESANASPEFKGWPLVMNQRSEPMRGPENGRSCGKSNKRRKSVPAGCGMRGECPNKHRSDHIIEVPEEYNESGHHESHLLNDSNEPLNLVMNHSKRRTSVCFRGDSCPLANPLTTQSQPMDLNKRPGCSKEGACPKKSLPTAAGANKYLPLDLSKNARVNETGPRMPIEEHTPRAELTRENLEFHEFLEGVEDPEAVREMYLKSMEPKTPKTPKKAKKSCPKPVHPEHEAFRKSGMRLRRAGSALDMAGDEYGPITQEQYREEMGRRWRQEEDDNLRKINEYFAGARPRQRPVADRVHKLGVVPRD